MSIASEIARAVAGVALGIVAASTIPRYDMPFGGCAAAGWLTLDPACAHWPEALSGFLFVGGIALLSPARWRLPLVGVLLLLIASLLGGIDSIKSGEHLYGEPGAAAFLVGYPLLVGGMLALAIWVFALRILSRRRDHV
jgi:hypothetical protein